MTLSEMVEYQEFLKTKNITTSVSGLNIDPRSLNPMLFDFQRDVVRWALMRGKAALFEDCGLGKTPQQLEWGHWVSARTSAPVLIFAPLAVSLQTKREGEKFGIDVTVCEGQSDIRSGVNITNYEKMHHFKPDGLAGIICDESGILKAYDGKTRKELTEFASGIPYRLCATATPAPNDYMELGNHAEFLGIMGLRDMLSMFFVHDGGETSKWRLKGHAESHFWKWVCSWAVAIRKPSDLGYDDGRFLLPPLRMHQITVESKPTPGSLFTVEAATLQERNSARRESIDVRVAACSDLIGQTVSPWLVWCNLNAEQDALEKALGKAAVSVRGSDSDNWKIEAERRWRAGEVPIMISKPLIFGYGMNWAHCSDIAFVGLSDSWEQFYQAIRRCWRFGQDREVNCYVVTAEAEGAVVRNIERKEKQAAEMMNGMVEHMKTEMYREVRGLERERDEYKTARVTGKGWTAILWDCVESVADMESDSIDYVVTSPPFDSLYTYSNSERDMGNSKTKAEFETHFRFLIKELYRVIKPGRLISLHCMNLPLVKERDGVIGIRDFRGDLIRWFCNDEVRVMADAIRVLGIRAKIAELEGDEDRRVSLETAARNIAHEMDSHPSGSGFIFHSEVCIWKDPVTAMQRTKAIGLLYKQLKKDSTISRQGIPDYLITLRKPGENLERVTKTPDKFPVSLWQRYASPVWMDINASKTLQRTSAREEKDERHVAPLQLEVIERAIELWTNPDDLVLDPFGGIGSTGYVALQLNRKAVLCELKQSYFKQLVANLKIAEGGKQAALFSDDATEDVE